MAEGNTRYHYDPSLTAAIIFIVAFSLSGIYHTYQVIRLRSWYFIPFVVGSIVEIIGYTSRAINASEPSLKWTDGPYIIQALFLLLGPPFYAASIYMVLGRLIRLLRADSLSVVRLNWLTKIFLFGDIASIAAQGMGGGMLAGADSKSAKDRGQMIIIIGLFIQLVFFGMFIIVTVIFHRRIHKTPTVASLKMQAPWKRLLIVLYISSGLIMIRSIFRVIEYIMGEDGELMDKEAYIYIFDAVYEHPTGYKRINTTPFPTKHCAMEGDLPKEVQDYLSKLVKRLTDHLKNQLVGVYLFGSASYDAYQPGLSDLDVQAIVKGPLNTNEKEAIISRLTQASLPCPATKLEFVVYAQGSVKPANRHPAFELNLNTGPHQSDHISLDPANESSHWFLLDIAMGRQLGRCLYGADLTEAFGAIPRRWVLEGMADSLSWHQANEASSTNSVLNACRSWRYIATGEFCSKLEGVNWALKQDNCPTIVRRAVEGRKTGDKLDAGQVMELYDIVVKANLDKLETADN
ncbi:Streptomycin 3 adenylyltransferase [Fusarium napiforme]|uniref:Streptomycin 3 adenylyltransferase n=1 Tax=Fusarium napiforme TaxID=42672 RepID=A0A8H5JRP6_9HYPO|nr:Streptomycin 3 adenylyltransferase [Fusarium napiforme]